MVENKNKNSFQWRASPNTRTIERGVTKSSCQNDTICSGIEGKSVFVIVKISVTKIQNASKFWIISL